MAEEVGVYDLVEELRTNNYWIREEYVKGQHETAEGIAKRFGYDYIGGLSGLEILPAYDSHIVFLNRGRSYSHAQVGEEMDRVRNDGYSTSNFRAAPNGVYVNGFIVTRGYEPRGTVLLEGDPGEKPILVVGYSPSGLAIGLYTDTSPQHFSVVDDLLGSLGMRPTSRVLLDVGKNNENWLNDLLKNFE